MMKMGPKRIREPGHVCRGNNTAAMTDNPVSSMAEVFGQGMIFSPRAPVHGSNWLPPSRELEFMTGRELTISGDMPVICHNCVAEPEGLALLRGIGHRLSHQIFTYQDFNDRQQLLKRFSGSGHKIVVQHVHPPAELVPEACWVSPKLLAWLNNKAQLNQLVPLRWCPDRSLVVPRQLLEYAGTFPAVVKAATDLSTGGCVDVRICRTHDEIKDAYRLFTDCETVVIEEFLELHRVLNVQFTISQRGVIRYFGSSEQMITPDLKPAGNWLSPDSSAPADVIDAVALVATDAAQRGYTGYVGVDVGMPHDGSWRLIDLNFRLNASTTPLHLMPLLRTVTDQPCAMYRTFGYSGNFASMLQAIESAFNRGWLLPNSFFNPELTGDNSALPRAGALVPVESREHLQERQLQLAEKGFVL